VKKTRDKDLGVANDLKMKNDKLIVPHAKLFENFEHLKMALGLLRVSSSNSPSHISILKLYIKKSLLSWLLLLLIMILVLLTLSVVKHLF